MMEVDLLTWNSWACLLHAAPRGNSSLVDELAAMWGIPVRFGPDGTLRWEKVSPARWPDSNEVGNG